MEWLTRLFAAIFGSSNPKQSSTKIPTRPLRVSVPKPVAQKPKLKQTLVYRCLSLTSLFETGKKAPRCFSGVSGNFDGMGISFGALQWNFGQGTLQPILRKMIKRHSEVVKGIFKAKYPVIVRVASMKPLGAVKWAKTIQTQRKNRLNKTWKEMFQALGMTQECQKIQLQKVRLKFDKAIEWCKKYKLKSERAVALMFDIRTQNGSMKKKVEERIKKDWAKIPESQRTEVNKMKLISNCRAEASKPRWIEDVRKRKLLIATGKGKVHGIIYDLKEQFDITMRSFVVHKVS